MDVGKIVKNCRMCDSTALYEFLDLGFLPPADQILTPADLNDYEIHFPLKVMQCEQCGLTQLSYVVNPHILYGKTYSYESSITQTAKVHFFQMANHLFTKCNMQAGNFAIDIGSNVGVLLEGLQKNNIRVLGIDPAPRIATIANQRGIETYNDFINPILAQKILQEKGKAHLITATNVFAHIDDKRGFMESIQKLLDSNGHLVIEAPYLVDLIDNLAYDTIYLDHLEYLSIKPLVRFFRSFGMDIWDVERTQIHGNSIRIFVSWLGKKLPSSNIEQLLDLEEKKGMYQKEKLDAFAHAVKKHRKEFIELIYDLKKQGKKIVGMSAPAKGNTLLNYCKMHDHFIDYMAEKSHIKVGHFTPGMHIPIVPEERLLENNPDYAIIFAWNFAQEIMQNSISQKFIQQGGKFIIPIPKPVIVENNNNNYKSSKISEKMQNDTMQHNQNQELFGVTISKIDPVHMDERGIISDLVNKPLHHVGLITTEKNAVRGSHYHKKSWQYSYILSGAYEVVLAPHDQPTNFKKVLLHAGELITIPPFVIHQFKAVERAVMINMESE
ncbi:MAG: methyltransferase domain-containing protein, partial [Nanoarchaeota archaeon]